MTVSPEGTIETTMDAIETTASSLELAVAQAAETLGVSPDQVEASVLEETKGLFGKAQVRIRATIKAAPAPKAKRTTKKATEPKAAPKEEPEATQEAVVAVEEAGAVSDERPDVVASDADADVLRSCLEDLLSNSGLEIEIESVNLGGRYVNFELGGKDTGYVIGRRGETLNALQYLLNVISARKLSNGVRVTVDGAQYRSKRAEVLTKLATDIAEEVRKRGEEAVLDALPAFERRVIHQALSEIEGVVTYSEGEEPERRVVIAPAT
jgi:spoIIIJ-associated protein